MDTDKPCSGMIQVGAVSKIINNALGTYIQGATVNRRAKSIRDDLEANALFLSSHSESVLLISCDLAGLLPEFVATAREAIGKAAGLTSNAAKVVARPIILSPAPREKLEELCAYVQKTSPVLDMLRNPVSVTIEMEWCN